MLQAARLLYGDSLRIINGDYLRVNPMRPEGVNADGTILKVHGTLEGPGLGYILKVCTNTYRSGASSLGACFSQIYANTLNVFPHAQSAN